MMIERKKQARALAWMVAMLMSGAAVAQSGGGQSGQSGTSGQSGQTGSGGQTGSSGQGGTGGTRGSAGTGGQAGDSARSGQSDTTSLGAKPAQRASQRVSDALSVVRQLEAEPRMKQLLQQAKGVLIVPSYGRAALGVGAHGGAGLLLLKRSDGGWSGPAFYDLGGLTVGLQAGAEGGPMALVLNNEKAVNEFMKKNNLALSADAGLTVLNWSRLAQGTAGTGDVVAWSGTKGLFGDVAAVGINDIRFNQSLTNAYYGRTLSPRKIAAGTVSNPQSEPLQQALGQAATITR
ncbi:lipid-binding SYLF domain-containing protein [Oxalobacteraceae bacterium OTU3REALA1]|nr:lipid-binding SYLF domain-containing protein [Oxalobacteraceae bacterium OTU3REALA1]